MKKNSIICILFISFLLCVVMLFPIDFAVTRWDLLKDMNSYYIVEWDQITGASWKIVGNQDGYYDIPMYVEVDGDLPAISSKIHLSSGGNKYICRGTFIKESEINDIYIYNFDNWDILYPISRNSIFDFLPDNYICLMDLIL